ncbi:hypothetical protein [Ferviditalea candida]|uniref:Uncharacterized protein n=1 Tax=Ferviditalea candida TaxID=3108399 RepID=A0ABU5ZNB9_9BACL|nr:hypothetical protein [Paenibacillaceae bacterium T2]
MEQLREVLKEVLKEELSPRLDRLENRMSSMETQMSSMQKQVSCLEEKVSSIEKQMSSMSEQLDRIERTQTEDVVAMLQMMDKKATARLDRHESQINLLNNRLLAVEADVQKILST